jgi:hypothetical protein
MLFGTAKSVARILPTSEKMAAKSSSNIGSFLKREMISPTLVAMFI